MKYIKGACAFLWLFHLYLSAVEAQFTYPSYYHPSLEWDANTVARVFNESVYDKRIRPRTSNFTTELRMAFYPISINTLDPVSGTMSTTGWLKIKWRDQRLTFPKNDNWALQVITIPQDDVWHPDMVLKNTVSDLKFVGEKKSYLSALSDGSVLWNPYHVFESQCELDLTYFPFDSHSCELQFTTWSFKQKLVYISRTYIKMTDWQNRGQFDLISMEKDIRIIEDHSVAVFTVKVKRKPFFITMTIILPILLMGFLSVFVFQLPFDSGEKVSFTVTVFLAFMVTLSYVTSILPDQSKSISYLTIYLGAQVIVSVIQTLITILLCRWYAHDESITPIPKLLAFMCTARSCFSSRKINTGEANAAQAYAPKSDTIDLTGMTETATTTPMTRNETNETNCRHQLEQDTAEKEKATAMAATTTTISMTRNETNCRHQLEQDAAEKEKATVTWKSAINRIDKICFIIFFILNMMFTVLYFVGVARHVSTF